MHVPTFDDILVSDTARDDYLGIFEGTGVSIAGLNCNGNPLHPDRVIGEKHAEDIRRSIRLADRLGQHRVVTMSGLPGGEPGATGRTGSSTRGTPRPWTCSTTSGPRGAVLEGDRPLAPDHDVKVALELHPQNIVFNTADVHRLIELTGATHVGVELDASHLFWQQMDPVAVVRDSARWSSRPPPRMSGSTTGNAALYGVLDNSFRRLSPEEAAHQPRRRRVGQPVAQGLRLGLRRPRQGPRHAYWTEFLRALDEVDPDMIVNIEHEDTELGRFDGLEVAAKVPRGC